MDEVFGATESYVEFTPDLLDKLTLKVQGREIYGRYFLQQYQLKGGGEAAGQYGGGQIAAVTNRYGKGRTLLIGTFPGAGYYLHHSPGSKAFFAGLLEFAGIVPRLRSSNPQVQARLHEGAGGRYLWVLNPSHQPASATVSISGAPPKAAEDMWGGVRPQVQEGRITVAIPARDGAVLRLQ